MIWRKYVSNNFTKYISCKCECKFNGRKCNSNGKWNNDTCWCECKKDHICKNDHTCIPFPCSFKNEKYLASIIDDSVVICDEIIDVKPKSNDEKAKAITINFNEKT